MEDLSNMRYAKDMNVVKDGGEELARQLHREGKNHFADEQGRAFYEDIYKGMRRAALIAELSLEEEKKNAAKGIYNRTYSSAELADMVVQNLKLNAEMLRIALGKDDNPLDNHE